MKKPTLTLVLLSLAIVLTIIFTACRSNESSDIPKADISSVLDVLDDDISGITWYNETTITLNENIMVSGNGVAVKDSSIKIMEGGNYIITGTLSNGSITVATDDPVNLTLRDANITNLSGPAISIEKADVAYITLSTETSNFLVDGQNYDDPDIIGALVSKSPLYIQGKGTLTVSGANQSAINCQDALTINNGSLYISAINDGIQSAGTLTINGGNIDISKLINGITTSHSLYMNDGVLSISDTTNGSFSKGETKINGGTLNILNCTMGIISESTMIIDDGTLNIDADHTALLSKDALTINDGHIHLDSDQETLSAAYSITINDGTILVLSNDPNKAGIKYGNQFKILGGTLLATGGSIITPTKAANTQKSLLLDTITAHTLIHIQQDASSVLSFVPAADYPYILFSSPLLQSGFTYDIYLGGELIGGTDFYGLSLDGSYRAGTKYVSLTL